jgi:hypothetical protein
MTFGKLLILIVIVVSSKSYSFTDFWGGISGFFGGKGNNST